MTLFIFKIKIIIYYLEMDKTESLDKIWESTVKSKADAIVYFKKYYPALTDHMIEGIVNYIENCIKEK